MSTTKQFLLNCLLLSTSILIYGQADSTAQRPAFSDIQTIFQRLQGYEKIIIKTNLDSLIDNKKVGQEQTATFLAAGTNQPNIKLPITIKARGKFRRVKCDLPPIKLEFKKSHLDSLGIYKGYDDLKLVTHCLIDNPSKASLLKEYWTYKMYNEVTSESFKVHLLEIQYIHDKDPKRKIKNWAFIIENAGELAHRLNGEEFKHFGTPTPTLTPTSYHNVLLFNYMIGNTDWIINHQKNIKLIYLQEKKQYLVIPYDFDFTAFVQPPYWKLTPVLGKPLHPANRIAMGSTTDLPTLQSTAAKFKALKKTGFSCFQECSLLSREAKKEMRQYLVPFFLFLKKEGRVKEVFGGE